MLIIKDLTLSERFIKIEPILKGWSEDKKFCVTDKCGVKYLLRISPIEEFEYCKSLFKMLQHISKIGVPMCVPIDFGICDDGVFSLHSWIGGEDLKNVLPLLSETEQHNLGLKAGEILKKIHSIPAPETQEDWKLRFIKETDIKIQKYNDSGLRFQGDNFVLDYIKQNRERLINRPQCYQHGDYQINNMMIENGELKIIDFDYGFGDPWQEFESIRWSVDVSENFATGIINGYFENHPPKQFWRALLLYFSAGMFHNILWGIPHGQEQIDSALKHIKDIFSWTANMQNLIPSWYKSVMVN